MRQLAWLSILLNVAAPSALWREHLLDVRLVNGEGPRKHLPATMPGGIAVFDFDNDGKLDLFFANGGSLPGGRKTTPQHRNTLLRNQGNFRFEDVTARTGLTGHTYNFAAAAGDYDGDGRIDLLVTGLKGVTLYRNLPDGTFQDVTEAANLMGASAWSVGAAWFDLENDGDLDLLLVNYVKWDPAKERECLVSGKPDFCHPRFYEPQPNTLLRNDGNGKFSDITKASGLEAHAGKGMGAAVADFDGDGLTDIFITNDRTFAFYFRNTGAGKFVEAAFDRGVAVPEDGRPVSGMGADAQDFDNDGRPDLIYTALRDETFPLYKNTGQQFNEATATSRLSSLSRSMSGWGVAFADLDNDGWKDIATARSDALSATGGRGAAAMEPPAWFRNTQDGKFSLGEHWGALPPAMYRGLVTADLDGDGCLDIVLSALNAAARILRNPCLTGRKWIKVAAAQPGARVQVTSQGLKQWRHSATAIGYASSYAGPLHFGLGSAHSATIEVTLTDGRKASMTSPANHTVHPKP